MLHGLGARHVDHRGVPGQDHPGPEHGLPADADALDDDAARADERPVLDHDRRGLDRLQDPAHAHAAGKVHPRADLCARADRRPRVDHGARAHPGPDVHVARHQDHARLEVGAVADGGGRHDPDPERLVAALQRELVVVLERPRLGGRQAAHAEVEEHGLLRPGVHPPAAVPVGLGHADLPPVEEIDRGFDRVRVELGGRIARERLPRPFDPAGQVGEIGHARTSASAASSSPAASSHAASGGTMAIRTYPSPSGPKNDPGATTTPVRSRRSRAHASDEGASGSRTQR